MPNNQKKKKSADIRTDRNRSELPILDRLLPLHQPTEANEPAPTKTDDRTSSGSEQSATSAATSGRVSINTHQLDYETPTTSLTWGRRLLAAVLPMSVLPMSVTVFAIGSLLTPAAAAAQDPAEDPSIKSVRFDVSAPEDGSVAYRSMVVTAGGVEHRLEPMAGSARVAMAEPHAMAMTAMLDGQSVAYGAEDFANRVSAAVTSPDVDGYVRLGATGDGQPVALDVHYDRPLGPGDHLLIQEGNGDSAVQVTAIDAAGNPTGVALTVGAPYQANTGHRHDPAVDSQAWASVIDATRFGLGPSSIPGVRITGTNVELKVLALVAEGATRAGPVPTSTTTDAQADGAPVYASVGLEAKVQPALAVDGAGCLSSPPAPVGVGQAATFCFLVTNLGTTHLTDIRITDPQLGLVNAVLPMATGEPTLAPGNQAVLFHHTVADERSAQVNSIVSARPVDGAGNSITNLIAPTGVGSPGPVGSAEAPPEPASTDVASAGVLTPTGEGSAMVEVPATRAITTDSSRTDLVEAEGSPPTQLAMTGVRTEPWILVIMAMGLIFVGYTAYSAFSGASRSGEFSGHDQLDVLGFD